MFQCKYTILHRSLLIQCRILLVPLALYLRRYKHYTATTPNESVHKCYNMAVVEVLLIYPHSPLSTPCVYISLQLCYNIIIYISQCVGRSKCHAVVYLRYKPFSSITDTYRNSGNGSLVAYHMCSCGCHNRHSKQCGLNFYRFPTKTIVVCG